MEPNEIIALNNNRVVGSARRLDDGRYQCYAYSHTDDFLGGDSVQNNVMLAANWLFEEAEATEIVRVSGRINRRTARAR